MTAYYNEIDPHAAAWLRALIAAGHIAPGVVDERSIEDVTPDELRGFTQCHFFAGIGVWSYALRSAGWPDDRPIWTGSCPCQPFSAAGAGSGFADERHLWPTFHHLIAECRPALVVGEQVASKIIDDWIDLVHADVEALGYAFGSVPFPSASVGAPHIRDRNYWVAHANSGRIGRRPGQAGNGRDAARIESERFCDAGGLADAGHDHDASEVETAGPGQSQTDRSSDQPGGRGVSPERLADDQLQQRSHREPGISLDDASPGRQQGAAAIARLRGDLRPGPTNGYWADADWLGCWDGKWRPVEPGTFPLAHGSAARVVRLRGYGNAINAEQAKIFIECAFPDLEESLI